MLYRILEIEEPDFGCEGCPEGTPLMDTVHLCGADGAKRTLTMADPLLYGRGLNEGDWAVLLPDGTLAASAARGKGGVL